MMSKGNTLTKEALGSVHYISPEQAKGGRVDNRSDIYSLGVVMYEMMSGRPPYDGESPVAVAIQHINGGAAMPSTLNPNIPGGLEQIIMKAMAHEPESRYNTATKMLADMDEFRKSPAILFDYNTPPIDEVTRLKKPVPEEVPARETTAERVAREKTPERRQGETPRRKTQGKTHHQPRKKEEKHSNIATIAIVSCSLVMVAAIAVFLLVLFNGGISPQTKTVSVPSLIGKVYDTLPEYMDFDIKINDEVHDNTYEKGQIIDQNPKAGDTIGKGNTIYVTVSLGEAPRIVDMPELTEWELSQAERNLNNLSMNLQIVVEELYHETVVSGNVIRTEPASGVQLELGQTVTLYVSKGVEIKTATMPNITGDKLESAKKILESQNLNLDIVTEEIFDSVVAVGDVIRSEPQNGETLQTGQKVVLYISKGPELVEIKNLVGLTVDRAVSILKDDGFVNYEIDTVESEQEKETIIELKVDNKTVQPGDSVDINSKIVLVVSKGPTVIPEITKDVVIDLRGSSANEACKVQVYRDGVSVFEKTVEKGVTSVTLKAQKGIGPQKYVVIINDQDGWDEWVEFTENVQ